MTKQEFLERAREKHGYKYKYPYLKEKILSSDDIIILYNNVEYTQKVVKHILLGRCPEKNTPTKTTKNFIKESKEIWGDKKYDYSLVVYKGAFKKVKIIFDGIVFEQTAISHLKGQCCENNLTEENFIRKSIIKHNNKYDYSMVKYISGDIPVLIGYNGIYYLQKPYHHLSGSKPENINLSTKKTTSQFIEESDLVHYNKYSYDKTIYLKNQEKVIITCPTHGVFSQRPLSHLNGSGCPNCGESLGERKISLFLKKKGINFERQKRFHDCRNIIELPFDFYIPSKRIVIEFDGIQHFQPVDYFGGLESYEKLKINDKIKNEYCEDNFINLIRIKYDQVNIINEILSKSIY